MKYISWTFIKRLFPQPIKIFSAAFPFIGYLIILSDVSFDLFNMNSFIGDNNNLLLSTEQRLHFIYFSLLFIFFGNMVFQIFCPDPIKNYISRNEYAINSEKIYNSLDYIEVNTIIKKINSGKNLINKLSESASDDEHINLVAKFIDDENIIDANSNYKTQYLGLAYKICDISKIHFRCLSFALWVIGIMLAAVPSLDVFTAVVGKIFK